MNTLRKKKFNIHYCTIFSSNGSIQWGRRWVKQTISWKGEFALPFGDYKVSITVPSDHIVAATRELKNATSCLLNK